MGEKIRSRNSKKHFQRAENKQSADHAKTEVKGHVKHFSVLQNWMAYIQDNWQNKGRQVVPKCRQSGCDYLCNVRGAEKERKRQKYSGSYGENAGVKTTKMPSEVSEQTNSLLLQPDKNCANGSSYTSVIQMIFLNAIFQSDWTQNASAWRTPTWGISSSPSRETIYKARMGRRTDVCHRLSMSNCTGTCERHFQINTLQTSLFRQVSYKRGINRDCVGSPLPVSHERTRSLT